MFGRAMNDDESSIVSTNWVGYYLRWVEDQSHSRILYHAFLSVLEFTLNMGTATNSESRVDGCTCATSSPPRPHCKLTIAKYRGHSKMVILNLIFPVETCPADVSSSAFAPGIATGCCAFGVFAIGLASAGPKGRQRDQLIKMVMSSISGFEGWRRSYFMDHCQWLRQIMS